MLPEHSRGLTACSSGRDNIVHEQNALACDNVTIADSERVFLIIETPLNRNTFLWPCVSPASQNMFVSRHTEPARQHVCDDTGRIKSSTKTNLPALRNGDHHVGARITQFLVAGGAQQIGQRRGIGS